MYAKLKILAILVIIALNVEIWTPLFFPPSAHLAPIPRGTRKMVKSEGPNYPLRTILGVLVLAGVTLFTVDAFRRTYESPRGHALGMAIGGYFTLGLTSLIYYVRWGIEPVRSAEEVYGKQFCSDCLNCSTDQSAGDTTMLNFAVGSSLVGDDNYCPECKSRIKTLWAIVLMPLFPFGSYRVIPVGEGVYLSRRIKLSWRQVCFGYLVGAMTGGIVLVWLIWNAWAN